MFSAMILRMRLMGSDRTLPAADEAWSADGAAGAAAVPWAADGAGDAVVPRGTEGVAGVVVPWTAEGVAGAVVPWTAEGVAGAVVPWNAEDVAVPGAVGGGADTSPLAAR
jgi:hypothetical protein